MTTTTPTTWVIRVVLGMLGAIAIVMLIGFAMAQWSASDSDDEKPSDPETPISSQSQEE